MGAFHQADDVAHAENAVGHAVGMEHVECLHLFAGTYKENGLVDHGAYGECRTASGVAVQFGEYHAFIVQAVVELLGGVHRILSGHGIDHKERVVGLGGLLDGSDFLHQFLINGEASGSIDDDGVVAFGLGLLDTLACNLHGVFLFQVHVDGHLNLLSQYAQLLYGSGTVHVAGHEQWLAALLVLQIECQLA